LRPLFFDQPPNPEKFACQSSEPLARMAPEMCQKILKTAAGNIEFSPPQTPATEAQMPTYRTYFLDADNHIADRRDIEAESDEEAIRTARQWTDGKAIEVWCGPVLVETIKPIPKPKRRRW
jgi:hypothetical protein